MYVLGCGPARHPAGKLIMCTADISGVAATTYEMVLQLETNTHVIHSRFLRPSSRIPTRFVIETLDIGDGRGKAGWSWGFGDRLGDRPSTGPLALGTRKEYALHYQTPGKESTL